MLSAERRRKIVSKIAKEGIVEINELANQFGVSAMTIRRDLDFLEAENKIVRTHGGAIIGEGLSGEFSHKWKDEQNITAKESIARIAASMVHPGYSVILDAGSTNLRIARELVHLEDIFLVTNDVKIAVELGDEEGIQVFLTGGQLKRSVFSLEGHVAESVLSNVHVDLAFIGCDAFDLSRGAMSNSFAKIKLKQVMLKNAQRRVLVADSSKFDQRALFTFAELELFHTIITDENIPVEFIDVCRQQGIEVIPSK
jgi:DeoR/GlpR family transcriptional regulator of sugar metabolism